MATYDVIGQKSAEAIVVTQKRDEGPNTESREGASMSSHDTKNPTGGVSMGHVMESADPNDDLQLFKEL
jgi:hypothetical protein